MGIVHILHNHILQTIAVSGHERYICDLNNDVSFVLKHSIAAYGRVSQFSEIKYAYVI